VKVPLAFLLEASEQGALHIEVQLSTVAGGIKADWQLLQARFSARSGHVVIAFNSLIGPLAMHQIFGQSSERYRQHYANSLLQRYHEPNGRAIGLRWMNHGGVRVRV